MLFACEGVIRRRRAPGDGSSPVELEKPVARTVTSIVWARGLVIRKEWKQPAESDSTVLSRMLIRAPWMGLPMPSATMPSAVNTLSHPAARNQIRKRYLRRMGVRRTICRSAASPPPSRPLDSIRSPCGGIASCNGFMAPHGDSGPWPKSDVASRISCRTSSWTLFTVPPVSTRGHPSWSSLRHSHGTFCLCEIPRLPKRP